MIINTGGRTDTVNYYCPWLLKRLEEGFVYSRNPLFPHKVTKYCLEPSAVDCIVFCSKNYTPILPHIGEIAERFNIYCHYTITAYGKDVEPKVPEIDESIDTLLKLSAIIGKEKLAWRYDPILLTKKYSIEVHLQTFEAMAKKITGHVDRCIFSFVEMYKRLERNMPEIILLTEQDKHTLAKEIGSIAKHYKLLIQTCGGNGDYSDYGINASGCMTLDIIGKANKCQFRKLKHKGMREGCHCIESRDIGAYDTCLNGCKYCYANQNPTSAFANFKLHDKNSPLLIGNVKPADELRAGAQKTFMVKR